MWMFLAQAQPSADTTGLLVVLGVFAVLGVAAFLLTRKRPPAPPPESQRGIKGPAPKAERRKPQRAADRDEAPDAEARRRARELRRLAKGKVKVGKGGKVKRVAGLADQPDVPDELAGLDGDDDADGAGTTGVEAQIADTLRDAGRTAAEAEQAAKLEQGLAKTRNEGFVARLGKLFAGKQIDANLLDEIEEVLFRADIGVQATSALLDALKKQLSRKELGDADAVWSTLEQRSREMVSSAGSQALDLDPSHGPAVLMVVGVNGSGKTTTIGKLAHRYGGQGRKILVAAGDTFRAAAVDQLEVWCERAGVTMHRGKDKQDPASVCYEAITRAKDEGYDLVICDTAGRLHTNEGLMRELEKVHRVIGKAHEGAPHEVMIVLDATMGQNAVQQAKQFASAVQVNGIALTKLDGTAKGGVVLAIAETLKIPVKLIGVGEQMSDLRDFEPERFIAALYARGDAPERAA